MAQTRSEAAEAAAAAEEEVYTDNKAIPSLALSFELGLGMAKISEELISSTAQLQTIWIVQMVLRLSVKGSRKFMKLCITLLSLWMK